MPPKAMFFGSAFPFMGKPRRPIPEKERMMMPGMSVPRARSGHREVGKNMAKIQVAPKAREKYPKRRDLMESYLFVQLFDRSASIHPRSFLIGELRSVYSSYILNTLPDLGSPGIDPSFTTCFPLMNTCLMPFGLPAGLGPAGGVSEMVSGSNTTMSAAFPA